jgi:hypothetical protein
MKTAFGNLREDAPFPYARWTSILMGGWLIASAFAFDRLFGARANSAICGVIAIAVALYAIVAPQFRRVNTVVGAWVILSTTFAPPTASRVAVFMQFVAGAVILLASLSRNWRPDSQKP